MDIYIERKVTVKFTMNEDEFHALRDLTALAQEYADHKDFPLNEKQAMFIGKVQQTYEEL